MQKNILLKEIRFKTSRSGGPGGQHANKVSTKVTLLWDPKESKALNLSEKEHLLNLWEGILNQEGGLSIDVTATRSQIQNKKIAISRLILKLERALKVPKSRKSTRPTRSSVKKRLKMKKIKSEQNKLRANKNLEN